MPVEIRELIIRTTVVNNAGTSVNSQGSYMSEDAIITACVEQVLKILERKKER